MKQLVFLLLPFFTSSEVLQDFSNCNQFFWGHTPPTIALPSSVSVQHICQCLWGFNKEKIYSYATLYSTTWKIPIYSAYVFDSPNIGRSDAWYNEPQLDGDPEPCMRPQGYGKNIGKNQAVYSDYEYSGYDKGHLYPVLHTGNHLSMLATSTMTNAAPQDPGFNRRKWLAHERAVAEDLKSCAKAYVVTGVVPNTNVSKMKGRVTVSKYYWRATCCVNNNHCIKKGYYGPDDKGNVQELTIYELQDKLSGPDGYNTQIPIRIFTQKRDNLFFQINYELFKRKQMLSQHRSEWDANDQITMDII